MATKTMTLGNSTNTVNLTTTGNIVGANIKSKGSATQPIYFDANGVAQNASYPGATHSAAGLMSAADKTKLDGINIVYSSTPPVDSDGRADGTLYIVYNA